MAQLENIRHEWYSRYLAARIPPYRAYPMAGYKFNAGNCYRLKDDERVKARVEELLEEGFKASDLTSEQIISGLAKEAGLGNHKGAKEGSTRVRAYELLGKHLGIWHADKPAAEMTEEELVQAVQKAIASDPKVRAAALEVLGGSLPPSLAHTEAKGSAWALSAWPRVSELYSADQRGAEKAKQDSYRRVMYGREIADAMARTAA